MAKVVPVVDVGPSFVEKPFVVRFTVFWVPQFKVFPDAWAMVVPEEFLVEVQELPKVVDDHVDAANEDAPEISIEHPMIALAKWVRVDLFMALSSK